MKRTLDAGNDAFGRALRDHLEGRGGEEIVERSDGYVALSAGGSAYFAEPTGVQKEVADRARGRVLDLGCGAGRYALYLQDRGLDVVGIDISPTAVEVCRRRGLRDVRLMSVDEMDASLGTFDTVLMLGHNLGLLGSFQGAKRLLRRLAGLVHPGALLIGDTLDPYQTDDLAHLAYQARNRAQGRMGGQIRMRVRYKALKTPWFDYLFLSRQELEEILQGTSWRLREVMEADWPTYVAFLERLPEAVDDADSGANLEPGG